MRQSSDIRVERDTQQIEKMLRQRRRREKDGKEGKTAGDILHDRLTSRREGGTREGSIGAEGPNGAANSHRKERWERASDLLKHELADRPTGNARARVVVWRREGRGTVAAG